MNQQDSRYRESPPGSIDIPGAEAVSRLHYAKALIQTICCHGFLTPQQDQLGLLRGEYDTDLTAGR